MLQTLKLSMEIGSLSRRHMTPVELRSGLSDMSKSVSEFRYWRCLAMATAPTGLMLFAAMLSVRMRPIDGA